MLKKIPKSAIPATALLFIPMIAGLILWNRLPEQMPIHFNAQGVADDWAHKAFAVFGIPVFMIVCFILCVAVSLADPKRQNIEGKPFALVLWICPFVSLLIAFVMYATALGFALDVTTIMCFAFGLLFVIIGNYMPKCRSNYTIGIKLPWTLSDSENWNKTHRMAGYLWVICGAVMMCAAFLKGTASAIVFTALLLVMVLVPTVYSYSLFEKKQKNKEQER